MPALSSDQANSAIIAHFQVPVDGDIGLQVGEDGMILTSVTPDETRQWEEEYDHLNRWVGGIGSRPEFMLAIEGKTTIKTALLPGAAPGTALTLAEVASLNPAMVLGTPTDQGFLSVRTNKRTALPAKLFGCSINAKLCYLPTANIEVFLAA